MKSSNFFLPEFIVDQNATTIFTNDSVSCLKAIIIDPLLPLLYISFLVIRHQGILIEFDSKTIDHGQT